MFFITQKPSKLIKNLVLLSLCLGLLLPCVTKASSFPKLKTGTLSLPNGKKIKTYLAQTEEEQTQGLSGLSPESFADNETMLFVYLEDGPRRFWMPDTYFNLDIFFLSSSLKVVDVERDVLSHPGRDETFIPIARTRTIFCRHVLELKSSSALAKEIKKGTILKWSSSFSLPGFSPAAASPGTKPDTHQKQ